MSISVRAMYRPVGAGAFAAATLSWSSTRTAVSLTGGSLTVGSSVAGSAAGCGAWPGAAGPTRVTSTAASTAAAATLVVVMLRMRALLSRRRCLVTMPAVTADGACTSSVARCSSSRRTSSSVIGMRISFHEMVASANRAARPGWARSCATARDAVLLTVPGETPSSSATSSWLRSSK